MEALGMKTIEEMRNKAIASLKEERFVEAIKESIRVAGTKLKETLPVIPKENRNELKDHLLIFHPRPN
jgi:uncharacterized membrane protein